MANLVSRNTELPRLQTLLIGAITDSSNPLTKGDLARTQWEYLRDLESNLQYRVKVRQASYQHPSARHEGLVGSALWPLYAELLARRENSLHEARYKATLSAQPSKSFRKRAMSLLTPLVRYSSRRFRSELSRLKAIETIVSDKHIFLWTSIVETGAVGGLIFEADFDPGPRSRWQDVPAFVHRDSPHYDYIDFSASFTFEKLGLGTSEGPLSLNFLTTNTLCAYWISKRAAEEALRVLAQRPWLRTIGADFLLNAINSPESELRSLLLSTPLIRHASISDRSKSTIGTL